MKEEGETTNIYIEFSNINYFVHSTKYVYLFQIIKIENSDLNGEESPSQINNKQINNAHTGIWKRKL